MGGSLPACSDGEENDGDGLEDFPADPGCTDACDATEYCLGGSQCPCDDLVDSDHDGFNGFPFDPGCLSPTDTSEKCVAGVAGCYTCDDGVNNDVDFDADGGALIDYVDPEFGGGGDPECTHPADNFE